MTPREQFGSDGDAIKRWLAQRASYASEEVRLRVDPSLQHLAAPQPILDDPAQADDQRPDAATAVIAALREAAPQAASARPPDAPEASPAPAVEDDAPGETPAPRPARRRTPRERQQRSDATFAARATNVVFAPRMGIRRTLGVLLVLMVAATGLAGMHAYLDRGEAAVLVASALAALTMVTWGARAAAMPAVVAIRHGQLRVVRSGRVEVADIANARTAVAVVGRPSSPRWRVLIERPDAPLLVIDRSMVDAVTFTEILYRLHPTLWSEPGAVLEPWQLR